MVKILLSGCNGKMGKVITEFVKDKKDFKIVAGIDQFPESLSDYPVYCSFSEYSGDANVVIDFSHPSLLHELLSYIKKRKFPAVIATTGLSQEQVNEIKVLSSDIPVFYTANMSLGVNLLIELCKKAARVLGDDFDIEIIEHHHNQKIDAPSGTAQMIADEMNESMSSKYHYVYDRHSERKKREKNEIGIHSIRGGTIVGEHEVLFAGKDEKIILSHSAASKEVFATGAVNAAAFIVNKKPGLYNMSSLILGEDE